MGRHLLGLIRIIFVRRLISIPRHISQRLVHVDDLTRSGRAKINQLLFGQREKITLTMLPGMLKSSHGQLHSAPGPVYHNVQHTARGNSYDVVIHWQSL